MNVTEEKNIIERNIDYIISFFIYSVVIWFFNAFSGWVINPEGGFDGGLLYGPYAPFQALLIMAVMLVFRFMKKYGKKKEINPTPILLLIMSVLIFMTAEYGFSLIYQWLTGSVPWDYGDMVFNINSRICWENTLFLTVGEFVCVYVTQPCLDENLKKFPLSARIIIAVGYVFLLFTDGICTFMK